MSQAADNLEKEAAYADSPATRAEPVLQFDIYTHEDVVRDARKLQAVRLGDKTYLPIFSEGQSVLPHCFVRSGLFPASENPKDLTNGEPSVHKIEVMSDEKNRTTVTLEGEHLQSYDRRIFAACLTFYRDIPLARSGESECVTSSYNKIGSRALVTRGSSTHLAIQASLQRLSNTKLTVGLGNGKRISIDPLIELMPEEATESNRSKIRFRIHESIAQLYGRDSWWRHPMQVLAMQGLAGWLGSFYSSHSKPKGLPVETLNRLSGLSYSKKVFRQLLDAALVKLKSTKTHSQALVTDIESWVINSNNAQMIKVITAKMDGNNPEFDNVSANEKLESSRNAG